MSFVELNNQSIEVVFHQKKTKHSYVRVKSPGIIHVTVGKNTTKKRMISYLTEHQKILASKVNKMKRKASYQLFGEDVKQILTDETAVRYDEENRILYLPKTNTSEYLKDFEKQLMLQTVQEMIAEFPHQSFIDLSNIKVFTRYTTTVHGSCNPKKKRINLNLHLIRGKKIFLHYVLMHEIAHLKVQNHSKAFYDVLRVLCPEYKAIKKQMKQT